MRLLNAAAALGLALPLACAAAPSTLSAEAARGAQIHARCLACHALAADRVGPRHCGLFGRRAGSVVGFDYSAAMKGSGIVWNERTLDRFLAAPLRSLPGTSMTYDGIADARERAALIAYLREVDHTPACRAR